MSPLSWLEIWRAMELGREEALLKFIAQGADVQQYEEAVKGMKGNGESSESESDSVELPETSSSSDLTESSSSSSEEGEGQEEINAGKDDKEDDGYEEDEDDLSKFDLSEYPLSKYHSIEDSSSENDSSEDVLQRTQKKRHRYSSYNCYRDEPPVCLASAMWES